jgi:hypothetical protein
VLITEGDVPRILAHLAEADASSGGGASARSASAPEEPVPGPEERRDASGAELGEPGETDALDG